MDQEIAQWLIFNQDGTVRPEIFDCLYQGDEPLNEVVFDDPFWPDWDSKKNPTST